MLPIASIAPGVQLDSVSFADKIAYTLAKHANMIAGCPEDRKLAKKLEKKIRDLLSDDHVIPYYARSRFFSALSGLSSDFYEPLKPIAKQIIDHTDADTIFERITMVYDKYFAPHIPYYTLYTAIENGFTVEQLGHLKPSSADCITLGCWNTLVQTAVEGNRINTLNFLKHINPAIQWKDVLCAALKADSKTCINHAFPKYAVENGDVVEVLKLSMERKNQKIIECVLPRYTPQAEDGVEILKVCIQQQNREVFEYLFCNAQEGDVSQLLNKVHTWKEKWSLSVVEQALARRQHAKLSQHIECVERSPPHPTVRKM